jgi:flagellar FliJ protein
VKPTRDAKEAGSGSDKQNVPGSVFRFRLERVRAVRERRENLAKQELAKAISRRASTEEELLAIDANLEHARVEQRSATAASSVVSGDELLARQAFLERVEQERSFHSRELQRREAEVAEHDAKLTTAATEHEMLNRLRDRHRGEHERAAARRERDELDDITVARFGRGGA